MGIEQFQMNREDVTNGNPVRRFENGQKVIITGTCPTEGVVISEHVTISRSYNVAIRDGLICFVSESCVEEVPCESKSV